MSCCSIDVSRFRLHSAVPLLLAAAAACSLASCGGKDAPPEAAKLAVVVSLAPLEDAAEAVGGKAVTVTDLTPVGGQPHGLEPAPAAITALKAAKVVFTVGPEFQPAVADALSGLPASGERIDLLGLADVLGKPKRLAGSRGSIDGGAARTDPHVWLSPARFIKLTEQIRDAFVKADPARRATYEAQAKTYLTSLQELDALYRSTLSNCAATTILTTHPAFGYLARDYGLRQLVVAGISLSATPDPASLNAVRRFAKAQKIETLFFSGPVPGRLARAVKEAAGVTAATLNPVEGRTQDQIQAGETYVKTMRTNLDELAKGLGCKVPGT